MLCLIGTNPILGGTLCIASGFLTAFTTISKTFLIKESLGILEFMGLLGFSGVVISSVQLLVRYMVQTTEFAIVCLFLRINKVLIIFVAVMVEIFYGSHRV